MSYPKDKALILAEQIMELIRSSGVNKIEATAAVTAAGAVLASVDDIKLTEPWEGSPERRSEFS